MVEILRCQTLDQYRSTEDLPCGQYPVFQEQKQTREAMLSTDDGQRASSGLQSAGKQQSQE